MRAFRAALTAGLTIALVVGCSGTETVPTTLVVSGSTTTTAQSGPLVAAVAIENRTPATYDLVEMKVDVEAEYDNPFDQRQVGLDASFIAPDGSALNLPGFWDGEGSWLIRFTPTMEGTWGYEIVITDHRGQSPVLGGSVDVSASDHPGFIRAGDQVDPDYSPRYFAHEDGTPWYGRGHADLDMSLGGASPDGQGLRKLTEMAENGENYEMWWPMWGNNYIQESYDNYSPAQMNVIDFVVRDAEAKGIALVYTIWGHQFLRTTAHDWPDDRWNFNGFSELTDLAGFFTDEEAWAWQENFYRYVIARWSYSPAILMWQTVTEINGTESYDETDSWHERVNHYFQANDPYRHPTTATKSGAQDWPEGHAVMDVPQVHLYHVFGDNPVADTTHFAEWTTLMWDRAEKPNWIGEYGNRVQALYPEFMHNANWASLATGAAMTPTEWNDRNAFGTFDEEMKADMRRFADFIEEVPLVVYDPELVTITPDSPELRGWGVVGDAGGVVWVQDRALDHVAINELRDEARTLTGAVVTVDGLAEGRWTIDPYDTWEGVWLDTFGVECQKDACDIPLPEFRSDLALHLTR